MECELVWLIQTVAVPLFYIVQVLDCLICLFKHFDKGAGKAVQKAAGL